MSTGSSHTGPERPVCFRGSHELGARLLALDCFRRRLRRAPHPRLIETGERLAYGVKKTVELVGSGWLIVGEWLRGSLGRRTLAANHWNEHVFGERAPLVSGLISFGGALQGPRLYRRRLKVPFLEALPQLVHDVGDA